jgi:hypothetical protein
MTEPTYKTPEIRNMLDHFSKYIGNRKASESIEKDICWRCGKSALEFTDEISQREYRISGLCQKCQDEIFVEEEE